MKSKFVLFLFLSLLGVTTCQQELRYDLIINNGLIFDGSGDEPFQGSLAIKNGKIESIGVLPEGSTAKEIIDVGGKAVAPGFINMLSWATDSLIHDGRSQSDIRQGVTLEVMGESFSMGPLNDEMKSGMKEQQSDIQYEIQWTTLGEYLQYLEDKGVSTNVASFLGTGTIRIHEIGFENRDPEPDELERMKAHVKLAMEEGAMGIASALIYVPDTFNSTETLIELAKVAAEYDGMYISHLRSEGNSFIQAIEELLTIARESGIDAEIYHLKAAGTKNWSKLDQAIELVEDARSKGMNITADMYTYTAGATGLDASMPPWVQEGGYEQWAERLKDPELRKRVKSDMGTDPDDWENLYIAAGAENMILVDFKNEELKKYTGKTLAEVAVERGTSPEDTAMDLVIEDGSRVGTVYFLMSEENVKKQIAIPWVSFCSDSGSLAPEGVFLKSNPHPRAYGSFARLLGKYVREEKIITLQEAIRRLTSFPASNLKINDRGALKPGNWADIVVFDPDTIQDHATFEKPHQYATGVIHVFVNGVQVLKDGEHTGATPGVFVKGPGWKGHQ